MDNLADALILGFSECQQLGAYTEMPDAQGRSWLQFFNLGLRLPK